MNKTWDKNGVAFDPEFWKLVFRVMKPGAHLLAFGGTRTYHRMTCAIEDAGFEIRDSLHWFYGTGFPKSLNLGEGRGTALKPGHEPIVLARKPLIGTVAKNLEVCGTGALNIDTCRIATDENLNGGAYSGGARPTSMVGAEGEAGGTNSMFEAGGGRLDPSAFTQPKGRWPANVLLDADAANELDEYSDSASRFFYVAKPSRKERDFGCDGLPQKTAGEATDRNEDTAGLQNPRAGAGRTGGARNFHPTVKPVELMSYLIRLVTPVGGWVLDPFFGSGTTGIAAAEAGMKIVGIESSAEYLPIALARTSAILKETA